jgi:hypothetical protein
MRKDAIGAMSRVRADNSTQCRDDYCWVLLDEFLDDIYIVDEAMTFLATSSHHDILTASGSAKAWLQGLTDGQENLIKPLVFGSC